MGVRHLIAVGLKTESPDADYVSGDFFMHKGERDLKTKIFGDAPGSREGSEKLPPPRDCNRDESRDKATVPKGWEGAVSRMNESQETCSASTTLGKPARAGNGGKDEGTKMGR
jgi:hypothetical protein